MANPEHVAMLLQGAPIDEWREEYPEERLDLSGANLSGANLMTANLVEADLSGALLTRADLLLADLRGADLTGAELPGANLQRADLSGAKLTGAELYEARLVAAELVAADLSAASLSRADLSMASLAGANLSGADLTGARLAGANLSQARLDGASLSNAVFDHTLVTDCDLSRCAGLETATHAGPSSIGVDTLVRTSRAAGGRLTPALESFFRRAGVPEELLRALPHIVAQVRYYSCLIAYGEPDRAFAEGIYKELLDVGVPCWLHHISAGLSGHARGSWREVDRIVLLCSAGALALDHVPTEIEEQMDEDPDKIIPLSLDELWKQDGFRVVRGLRDLKPFLLERNYADFGEGKDYEEALQRLLRALELKR